MANWKKVATDVGIGAVAGGLDAFVQEKTVDQVAKFKAVAANAGKKMPQLQRYSTYYNYGVPILATVAVAMGYPRSTDMQTRLMTIAGQLAGRRAGEQIIDEQKVAAKQSYAWHPAEYGGEAAANAAEAARASQEAARRSNSTLPATRGSL